MASIFPLEFAYGIYSLRFRAAGTTSGNFIDHEYQFSLTGNTNEQLGGVQNGVSPTVVTGSLSRLPVDPGSVTIRWRKPAAVVAEDPTVAPAENGVILTFTVTFANAPVSNDTVTIAWQEAAVAKTATLDSTGTIGGANAANITSATLNRETGVMAIVFAGGHPPDANTIRVSYTYGLASSSVTDLNGRFSAAGVAGTINYVTGAISITFTGAAVVPYNGGVVTVDYGGAQAWSKGIRIVSSLGGYVEFSFDGVNVHGRVSGGAVAEYLDRYEPGIAIRGSGDFVVEAW